MAKAMPSPTTIIFILPKIHSSKKSVAKAPDKPYSSENPSYPNPPTELREVNREYRFKGGTNAICNPKSAHDFK